MERHEPEEERTKLNRNKNIKNVTAHFSFLLIAGVAPVNNVHIIFANTKRQEIKIKNDIKSEYAEDCK